MKRDELKVPIPQLVKEERQNGKPFLILIALLRDAPAASIHRSAVGPFHCHFQKPRQQSKGLPASLRLDPMTGWAVELSVFSSSPSVEQSDASSSSREREPQAFHAHRDLASVPQESQADE
jgi:hypothetical protein